MSQHMHLCLDIRGALRNKDGWKAVSSPDGRRVKKEEAREWLMDRLAEGKRVLPMGPCEGFSFQTGCPGHEDAEEPARRGIPIGDHVNPPPRGPRPPPPPAPPPKKYP